MTKKTILTFIVAVAYILATMTACSSEMNNTSSDNITTTTANVQTSAPETTDKATESSTESSDTASETTTTAPETTTTAPETTTTVPETTTTVPETTTTVPETTTTVPETTTTVPETTTTVPETTTTVPETTTTVPETTTTVQTTLPPTQVQTTTSKPVEETADGKVVVEKYKNKKMYWICGGYNYEGNTIRFSEPIKRFYVNDEVTVVAKVEGMYNRKGLDEGYFYELDDGTYIFAGCLTDNKNWAAETTFQTYDWTPDDPGIPVLPPSPDLVEDLFE